MTALVLIGLTLGSPVAEAGPQEPPLPLMTDKSIEAGDTSSLYIWQVPLPPTNSSPRVLGDLVCTTSEPVTISCFNRTDGTLAWSREQSIVQALTGERKREALAKTEKAWAFAKELETTQTDYGRNRLLSRRGGASQELFDRLEAMSARITHLNKSLESFRSYFTPTHEPYVGWSTPTPVVHENSLITLFGNGVIARLNADGTTRWSDWLGEPPDMMKGWVWGTTASPIVSGDSLLVPYGHLQSLSVDDGTLQWIDTEPWVHLGSPSLVTVAGEVFVATPGGRILRVDDGSVAAENLAEALFTAPLVKDNRVFWVGAKAEDEYAVYAVGVELEKGPNGGLLSRELFRTQVTTKVRLFGSPRLAGSDIIVLPEHGLLRRISIETGQTTSTRRITPSSVLATPLITGETVYTTNTQGGLIRFDLDSNSRTDWSCPGSSSSPIVEDDGLYIRTRQSLGLLRGTEP